ncbi:MAG: small-conductance mechanosensitive ion channel [Chloroflexi bacterium]|nr:small-conductance mechanosensitive ion channel [Chloroflexota bacterium]
MGDAVLVSVTEALQNFLGFLPQLVGAIIILVLGWIIAGLLAGLVETVLKRVGFERAAESTGIAGFVKQAGSDWTVSKVVAEIVKWFVRLVALQAAASILGMTQISEIINSILLWLPNLVVALAIVVLGAFLANFVSKIVRGTVGKMGFDNPDLFANIARFAIIGFAIIAAVDQLGIAETVVNTLLIGVVAALAAAFALAFGLGGQRVAGQITQSWYEKGQAAGQKVSDYAQSESTESTPPARDTVQPPTTPQTEPPITRGSTRPAGG